MFIIFKHKDNYSVFNTYVNKSKWLCHNYNMDNVTIEIIEHPCNETCCDVVDYYCFDILLENNNYIFHISLGICVLFVASFTYVFFRENPTWQNME